MQYYKHQQSDLLMLTRAGRQFALIFLVILMFDSLIEWLLALIDLILEGIHIITEAIEYSIEIILGLAFHTDHQQSEIIIVNGAIILAITLSYRLYKAVPNFYNRLKNKLLLRINRKYCNWQAMSIIYKIKLIAVYSLGISCLLLLISI